MSYLKLVKKNFLFAPTTLSVTLISITVFPSESNSVTLSSDENNSGKQRVANHLSEKKDDLIEKAVDSFWDAGLDRYDNFEENFDNHCMDKPCSLCKFLATCFCKPKEAWEELKSKFSQFSKSKFSMKNSEIAPEQWLMWRYEFCTDSAYMPGRARDIKSGTCNDDNGNDTDCKGDNMSTVYMNDMSAPKRYKALRTIELPAEKEKDTKYVASRQPYGFYMKKNGKWKLLPSNKRMDYNKVMKDDAYGPYWYKKRRRKFTNWNGAFHSRDERHVAKSGGFLSSAKAGIKFDGTRNTLWYHEKLSYKDRFGQVWEKDGTNLFGTKVFSEITESAKNDWELGPRGIYIDDHKVMPSTKRSPHLFSAQANCGLTYDQFKYLDNPKNAGVFGKNDKDSWAPLVRGKVIPNMMGSMFIQNDNNEWEYVDIDDYFVNTYRKEADLKEKFNFNISVGLDDEEEDVIGEKFGDEEREDRHKKRAELRAKERTHVLEKKIDEYKEQQRKLRSKSGGEKSIAEIQKKIEKAKKDKARIEKNSKKNKDK